MKTLFLVLAPVMLISASALASEPPTSEEVAKINEAMAKWGCSGGTAEVERDTGHVEVDDVKCADGREYDVKLNKDFTIHSLIEH